MGQYKSTEDAVRGWTLRLFDSATSKHQGIYDALVADIANGNLRPGDRLPPQRAVAAALGVDLTTVTKAYSRAREEGIIEATAGKGSFVALGSSADRAPLREADTLLDLSKNSPAHPQNPKLRLVIAKEIGQAVHDVAAQFNYQDTGGSWANRCAGSELLRQRIGVCSPERVVLTSGAQSALFAICHLLCKESKQVAVGEFSYPGIHTVAFQQRLQLVPLTMDEDGIIPAAFQEACDRNQLSAIYVTPTVDNPTTATLPEKRRQEIVEIARKNSVAIIEDDPYSGLLLKPLPTIASFAPDITWHVATLSKCISPALRLGYIAAPSEGKAQQLAAVLQAMTMMTSPLFAALASRWIYSGFVQDFAMSIREENVARQKLASTVLAGQNYSAHPEAPHIWLSLPSPWRAIDFVNQVERSGVIILASSSFAATSPVSEAVRISLSAAPDQTTLTNALGVIVSTQNHYQPNAMRAIV